MHKPILIMFLVIIGSTSAMAEWIKVSESDDALVYANPVSILKSGSRAKMWRMIDFKKAQDAGTGKLPIKSLKSQDEFDCKKAQRRNLFTYLLADNMGGGELLYSGNLQTEWSPIAPQSSENILWDIACGKKK